MSQTAASDSRFSFRQFGVDTDGCLSYFTVDTFRHVYKLLQTASERGHATMVVRLGQACGSLDTGAWSTTEWFPIMVKSSVALGCLPALKGVSIIPLRTSAVLYEPFMISSRCSPVAIDGRLGSS